jgi:hypothetical protein
MKFAVSVCPSTLWSQNSTTFTMYDTLNNLVPINVIKLGSGGNTDLNRNYIFVIPQGQLQPLSTYTINIAANLTGNNGVSSGIIQHVSFTTAADIQIPAAPAVTNDDTLNTVTGMAARMEYKLDTAGHVAI